MNFDLDRADCAIIGAGPAGLAAAMQASRAGLACALFEGSIPGGQALAANWIENFPGFPQGITGRELMERFLEQARSHDVKIRRERIIEVRLRNGTYALTSTSGETAARAIIVASGLSPKRLDIPGEESLRGKSLFYYCDPASIPHEGRSVLVIGDGDAAFDQALNFANKAGSVSIAMKHAEPRCAPVLARRARDAEIALLPRHMATMIEALKGHAAVLFDRSGGESSLHADLVIACVGKQRAFDFLSTELQDASTPGIYFAGDCRIGRMGHVAIAAGDGIKAAMDAAEFLK